MRRETAREFLDLDAADKELRHINKGQWGDVEISVRRLDGVSRCPTRRISEAADMAGARLCA